MSKLGQELIRVARVGRRAIKRLQGSGRKNAEDVSNEDGSGDLPPFSNEFWADTDNLKPKWHRRARLAAKTVRRGERVLDIGCGNMNVETHLPKGCHYQPSDVAQRDARTIVCDLNKGEMPPSEHYDVVMALGVLTYLKDPIALIGSLPRYGARSWCISYHARDLFPVEDEFLKRRNLPTPLNEVDFLNGIKAAGHTVKRRIEIGGTDILYVTQANSEI